MDLKREKEQWQREMRQKTAGYILTALGLVAGLAWNEAITALIKVFFPLDDSGLIAKFIYAVVITAVIVWLSLKISKITNDKQE